MASNRRRIINKLEVSVEGKDCWKLSAKELARKMETGGH